MKLPYLPYNDWKDTRITLHLMLQIIGKIRLTCTPRKNHWWYITQYVSTQGFTTGPIPLKDGLHTFEININVFEKAVQIINSKGGSIEFPLTTGYTIGAFYKDLMRGLKNWGVEPDFVNRPMDMEINQPFEKITTYHHYDWDAIHKFWDMMRWTDGVFKEFSGRFYGKTCPVHIYWHHMDLAVTRFSGKPAPTMDPNARVSDKDAYSHEVISFGFWAGDAQLQEPAFYSYTAPSPKGLDQEPLKPQAASWTDANGSPMAILTYKALLSESKPRDVLLDFLESAYQAGANRAGWDIEAFKVIPLSEL